jgi:hypothetical protein
LLLPQEALTATEQKTFDRFHRYRTRGIKIVSVTSSPLLTVNYRVALATVTEMVPNTSATNGHNKNYISHLYLIEGEFFFQQPSFLAKQQKNLYSLQFTSNRV